MGRRGSDILAPPMSLAPGTTLGPYSIVSQLGAGGMGVVYEATDPRLKRAVAIKLLPPDLTRDETATQRFLQEAIAASALDLPNICTITRSTRHQTDSSISSWSGSRLGHYDVTALIGEGAPRGGR